MFYDQFYFIRLHFLNNPDVVPDLHGDHSDDEVSDAEKERNTWKIELLRGKCDCVC